MTGYSSQEFVDRCDKSFRRDRDLLEHGVKIRARGGYVIEAH